jgi:NAD(P)H-dependent FMN reductase
MSKLYVPIIVGTHHDGSQSAKVAKHVLRVAEEAGLETELVVAGSQELWKSGDGGEFGKIWREKAQRADGFIIVSPEYNHGYPGELKLMLDTAFKEYFKKPVGVVGVSDGPIGGARMMENLRPVLVAFGLVATQRAVYVKNVKDVIYENGNLKEGTDLEKNTKGLLEEVVWYANVLKTAREAKM